MSIDGVKVSIAERPNRLAPPRSWRSPDTHYLAVLEDPWYKLIVRLQNSISCLTTEFWDSKGIRNVHLPITTGSVSSPMGRGSDSSPVLVNLMGVDTYLADSMQFLLELGCRLSDEGAYYLMPSFRGEDADATHLCQFFHSEAEVPGDLERVILLVEEYLRFLFAGLLARDGEEIECGIGTVSHLERVLESSQFSRISFEDAVGLLDSAPDLVKADSVGGLPVRSLTRAGERRLIDLVGEFTWVTHMDHLSVPFYQAFAPGDSSKAMSADLLFGIGEIVGAGMRHESPDDVLRALAEHEVEIRGYEWYVEMRRRSRKQTSGFGMGVERLMLWLMRHDDIRDMALLVRFNGSAVLP